MGTYGYVDWTGSSYEIRRHKLYAGISEAHSRSDETGIGLRVSAQNLKYRREIYARDSETYAHGAAPALGSKNQHKKPKYRHEMYARDSEACVHGAG